jgi:hypothetical protein
MGLYVLLSLSLVTVFSFPSGISALIVAPNVLLIPLLFGFSILTFLRVFKDSMKDGFLFLLSFFVGATVLTIIAVAMQLLGFPFVVAHLNFVAIVPIVLMYLYFGVVFLRSNKSATVLSSLKALSVRVYLQGRYPKLIAVILVIVVGIIAPSIVALYRPLGTIGVDHMAGVEFVQPVDRLVNEGIIDYWKARSMPVLIAGIPLMSVDVSALALYWAMPFIIAPLFALGMFFFVFRMTKTLSLSFVSAAVAVFLNGGDGVFHDPVSFSFRYSTLATAVLPWFLLYAYVFLQKSVDRDISTQRSVFSTLLLNFPIGVFLLIVATPLNPFAFQREEITSFIMIGVFCLTVIYGKFSKANSVNKYLTLLFLIFGMFTLTLDPLEPFIFYLLGSYLFVFIFWIVNSKRKLFLPKIHKFLYGPGLARVLTGLTCVYILLLFSGIINSSQLQLPFDRMGFAGTSYTLQFKFNALVQGNSEIVMVLFVISLATLSLIGKRVDLMMTLFTLVGLAVFFSPASFTMLQPHRTLCIPISYIIAAGMFRIINLKAIQVKKGIFHD